MEQNPTAPAAEPQVVAPAASEATPTTTSTEPAAPVANIPADQIEAFNKFVGANGGFEKAFAKLRSDVSNPAPKVEPEQQAQPVQQPQAFQQQSVESQVPEGYITQEEFAVQQYFNALANRPEYSQISDQIRSGTILNEMAKFNIRATQNGYINANQINQFLDLYAKTVPAQAPESPLNTAVPTADYVNVGEQITSRDDAMKILTQNQTLRAQGLAEHPQTQAAKDFIKGYFGKK